MPPRCPAIAPQGAKPVSFSRLTTDSAWIVAAQLDPLLAKAIDLPLDGIKAKQEADQDRGNYHQGD